jgi:predicted amidohydrolase YtcJ
MKTVDSTAEAIAVSGDRIIAVGNNSTIRKLIGPHTRVIDARGRLLIPGFNDAHVHFMGIGNMFSTFDLRGLTTAEHVANQIAQYVRFLPKGRWILGSGWKDEIAPPLSTIDKLSPDNPIFIYRPDRKSAFANSAALKLAKLTNETGVVRDAALSRIAAAVPANHTRNWIEIAETATNYAASLGVTSIQDMHSDDSRAVYRELERAGKLKTRVYDCLSLPDWKQLADSKLAQENTAMVRGGCVKGFSDGDDGAAARLTSDIASADKAGLQVMIHAIGNAANGIVLDAFEATIKSNGRRERRFRVEHAHNPRQTDLPRYSRSDLIASMQPHLFNGGSGGYYASLLRSRTTIALGSDAAITEMDPLLGIHAAVNAGSESISVYEAVRAYTVGSAYAEFQEKRKGMIEVGKLADFVILSDDIFSADVSSIRSINVLTTVIGGKVVYVRHL